MPQLAIGGMDAPSSTQASGAGSANAGTANTSMGLTPGTAPKRKVSSVVEMLEYVKSLGIDPIKEVDMVWIAEEAFNAPLPPGYTEHQDEQGRAYFHHESQRVSSWRHPMDDLFKDIVNYQRRAVAAGGFWQIEDEIIQKEDEIRSDLADWMELFAEDGEKFYYNRHDGQSRFDDPRMEVYHKLYARIKMVAKMKEKFPVLARAPRPEEPTDQEKDLMRKRMEDQARYLNSVLRVQSFIRVMIAKRRVRMARAQAVVQKGPQPLRGKLRLRMEKLGPGGGKELRLSQTTPHKRFRAAQKVQARARGMAARRKFKPLVQHRAFLSKEMTKVQCQARCWLARRRVVRKREEKLHVAASRIQRVWRGYKERQYVSCLRTEKDRFAHMLKSTITIQCGIRMKLARNERNWRQMLRFQSGIDIIKRQARTLVARREVRKLILLDAPVQGIFVRNEDPKTASVLPWSWQVQVAPWFEDPEKGYDAEPGENFVDLFTKEGIGNIENLAATKMQKVGRGMLGRKRAKALWAAGKGFVEQVMASVFSAVDDRKSAVLKMQARARGMLTRGKNLIFEKKNEHLKKSLIHIHRAQSYIRKYNAQEWLVNAISKDTNNQRATQLQAAWRGFMARKQAQTLKEEALWPVKGWFEYTATGRDSVQVEVCFLPNPSFDDFGFFVKHGSSAPLQKSLEELEEELSKSMTLGGRKGTAASEFDEALRAVDGVFRGGTSVDGSSVAGSKDPPTSAISSIPVPKAAAGRTAEVPPSTAASASSKTSQKKKVEEASSTAGSEAGSPFKRASLKKPEEASDTAEVQAVPKKAAAPAPVPKKAAAPPPAPEAAQELSPPSSAKPKAAAAPAKEASPAAPARQKSQDKGGKEEEVVVEAPVEAKPKSAPKKAKPEEPPAVIEEATPEEPKPAKKQPKKKDQEEPKKKEPTKAKKEVVEEPTSPPESEPASPTTEPRTQKKPKAKAKEPAAPPPMPMDEILEAGESQMTHSSDMQKTPKKSHKSSKKAPPEEEAVLSPSQAQHFLRFAEKKYWHDTPIPRPAQHQPRPPSLEPHGSARELSGSSSANALRQSQSTGALDGGQTPKQRKNYAGKMKNGKFERTKAETVEDMKPEERDAILLDIEENKRRKMEAIKEKSKKYEKMKKQAEQAKQDVFRRQMSEAEAFEEERRKKKVKELKKWLKMKEAEDAAKKAKDQAMMQEIVEKETQKAEALAKVEEERKAERERRLRANERAKAKLEEQMGSSKEAALGAPPQKMAPQMAQGPPEMVDPRMQQQQMHIQQQMMMQQQQQQMTQHPQQQMQGYPMMAPSAAPQRVVHRHIHHHVHYHEGGEDGEAGSPSMDDRRRIEMQSEDRIRTQLEAQEMSYGDRQSSGRMLPPVDHGAETPTSMQRAASMGQFSGPDDYGMRMTQTQQAFRGGNLPPVNAQELGRSAGVPNYGSGVQKAIGTYANSGRPTFIKKK